MSTPCSACKYLRRKCTQDCMFAPYFPANKYEKYEAVHKVFGASHVATLLKDIKPSQRKESMHSLSFEAETRLNDPVYGCTRILYTLQCRLQDVQARLAIAKKEIASYNIVPYQQNHQNPMMMPTTRANYDGQPDLTMFNDLFDATRMSSLGIDGHSTAPQLHEEAQGFASTQTAQMEQTPETRTQHDQRAMIDHDKNIPSKI